MSDENVQRAKEEVDEYEQAVNASLCFIHVYKWDENSAKPDKDVKHNIGKAYSCNQNKVTPDITLRLGSNRCIVAELKPRLPRDSTHWEEELKQVKKYDAPLTHSLSGEMVAMHQDLVLITNQRISKKIIAHIEEKGLSFRDHSKHFCVIQYGLATGSKVAYYLRKEYGSIEDFKTVTDRRWTQDGYTIEIGKHLINTGLINIRLLDYRPPSVYLMTLLWDHIFGPSVTEEHWRRRKGEGGKRFVELPVNVSELRNTLQQQFSDPAAEQSVQEAWIKEALDNFVKLKLAKKLKGQGKDYVIKYTKKIKGQNGDGDKKRLFAELLFKEGTQSELTSFPK
jgi:hypothetical protein